MRRGALLVVLALAACTQSSTSSPSVSSSAIAELLYPATGGDGDSWKDRSGREYRLGMVNAPELGECFGQAASDERKKLVRAGFRASVYTTDRFKRAVSVVTLADGRNLNVLLARNGYVDDRFLGEFRSENPTLAGQLDVAFAAARSERRGLWGKCPTAGPGFPQGFVAPSVGGCHPAYPAVCIPPPEPDLDCRVIAFRRFRVVGPDPHRFDVDSNGVGCERD